VRQAEVILVKDSDLGLKGDVVKVRPGYARNWLIPQQWAVYAIKENRQFLGLGIRSTDASESAGNEKNARELEVRKFMQHYSWRLRKVKLNFVRPRGETEDLARSVKPKDVLQKLTNEHDFIGLTEDSLVMEPIRQAGTFKIEVRLNRGWVLPGIGLFGELERLESTRNPCITINVSAQIKHSEEVKKARYSEKLQSRKLRKESKSEDAEAATEDRAKRDKANATGGAKPGAKQGVKSK
jgi:ribosomal protein L9